MSSRGLISTIQRLVIKLSEEVVSNLVVSLVMDFLWNAIFHAGLCERNPFIKKYLLESRVTLKGRQRHAENIFHLMATFYMVTKVQLGRLKPGTWDSHRFSSVVGKVPDIWAIFCCFLSHQQEPRLETEQLGLGPVLWYVAGSKAKNFKGFWFSVIITCG